MKEIGDKSVNMTHGTMFIHLATSVANVVKTTKLSPNRIMGLIPKSSS